MRQAGSWHGRNAVALEEGIPRPRTLEGTSLVIVQEGHNPLAQRPDVGWSRNVAQADWIGERLHAFGVDVGSIIPDGYPAYARIDNGDGWHGSLSPASVTALVELLASATGTPSDCWFCLWDGYGWVRAGTAQALLERSRFGAVPLVGRLFRPLHAFAPGAVPPEVLKGPLVNLPMRSYLLYRGAVEKASAWMRFPYWQTPNLWWPADRSWIVATEIDLDWTYVGGSDAVIQRVLNDPRLTASTASPTDRLAPI